MALIDLLFPPICSVCQSEGHWWCDTSPAPWPICLRCNRAAHPNHPPILALGRYDGTLRAAIATWKYHGQWAMSQDWAAHLTELVKEQITPESILVPIPLHWIRRLRRGYNQAEILARQLSQHLKRPVSQLLCRTRATHPQNLLTHRERTKNLHGSLALRQPITNQPIWLVDDIVTSRATLCEAERTIRRAGGRVAGAIVVALAQ